jgi:hypothetical protein
LEQLKCSGCALGGRTHVTRPVVLQIANRAVNVNMSFSYEEYADMHLCTGFAMVIPLLLSKNIGYGILDDESLTDVCLLVFINICEKKVPFQV